VVFGSLLFHSRRSPSYPPSLHGRYPVAFASLHPFGAACGRLSRFARLFATTRALSPLGHGSSDLLVMNSVPVPSRDPHFTSHQLPSILSSDIPKPPCRALAANAVDRCLLASPLSGENDTSRASPLPQRLARLSDCIRFNMVLLTGWMFASGCSPPHLSMTQLPSATESQLLSGRDFHPTVGVRPWAHRAALAESAFCTQPWPLGERPLPR